MRKFRGLNKDGKWVEGWYCKVEGKSYIIPDDSKMVQVDYTLVLGVVGFVAVDHKTVGQYTGHKDKNGKEIWEDDLYKSADGIISRVQMAVDGWALFSKGKKGAVPSLYWENVCDKTKGEVIGNIHENKDLLETKNE